MSTILVTGATGTIGGRVVRALIDAGQPPRALLRTADRAHRLPAGAEPVVADFADAAALGAAMRGVDRVFLASPNAPEQVAWELGVIDAAADAGVARMVKLSARGVDADSPVAFWRWHAEIEAYLRGSRVPSVALRPGFSMANILGHADEVRDLGMLPAPALTTPVAMIHPQDVADTAAHLLLADEFHDEQLELTGPQAVTFEQVAEAISRHAGRPVGYLPCTDEQVTAALGGRGVPPFVVSQILAIFDALRAGGQATTTDAVTQVTGGSGRTLEEFLHEHAAAFRRPAVSIGAERRHDRSA